MFGWLVGPVSVIKTQLQGRRTKRSAWGQPTSRESGRKLRAVESNFIASSLYGLRNSTLQNLSNYLLESNPAKSRFLVCGLTEHRRLAECGWKPCLPTPPTNESQAQLVMQNNPQEYGIVEFQMSTNTRFNTSGEQKPCRQKPCGQIYAHGLHGYVGASARVALLRSYNHTLSGTF